MAKLDMRGWQNAESLQQSPIDVELQSRHSLDDDFDDGFDYFYPASLYPAREFLTASAFILAVVALFIWGVWKVFSLI